MIGCLSCSADIRGPAGAKNSSDVAEPAGARRSTGCHNCHATGRGQSAGTERSTSRKLSAGTDRSTRRMLSASTRRSTGHYHHHTAGRGKPACGIDPAEADCTTDVGPSAVRYRTAGVV